MSTRIPVFEFVTNLCNKLYTAGKTISGEELAKALNKAGYRTSYNTLYVAANGRGIFTVARFTWGWLTDQSRHREAEAVAHTVVDSRGKPPWDK
jgi:hypothetical protein